MNAVLTAFLTGSPDPQADCGSGFSTGSLDSLLASTPAVVFADELKAPYAVRVARAQSVYFDRWRHYASWLAAHEYEFCFCVDATDVVMLREPWAEMHRGVLYCGSEPLVIGESDWMLNYHPQMRGWLSENADRTLLNCGLVGGDLETVLRLAQRMGEEQCGMLMDMGAFNYLAYSEFEIVTGLPVHTTYKSYTDEPGCWWRHK